MKKVFFKCFVFASLFIISCGGGGDGGSDNIITPPVQTVDPPSVATLTSPANNKVCEEGTSVSDSQSSVNFQWTAGNNTDNYYLRITNLNTNQVINLTNIEVTNKTVTLSKGIPYSWKVFSMRNGTSETVESSTWKFYLSSDGISNYPPYPSTLLSPISAHSFSSDTSSVELSWEGLHPENLTLTYDLYIDTTDGLQDPISSNQNLSVKSKSVQVSSGKSYYWRVKATDSNNNSSYSAIHSFKVE